MSRSFAHSPPLAWLLRTLAPPPPTPSLPLALLPLRSDLAFTYSYSLLCNTASSLPLPPRALLRCCSFSIAALTGRVVHRCGVGECDMKFSTAGLEWRVHQLRPFVDAAFSVIRLRRRFGAVLQGIFQ
ncbi:uncharacterized protein [Physcomitrium patens]|uniref:uncharacterized protein isoform X1 n=1 Tax=Physcomitrium patens TaxID=3218 RepID=UPI003CCD14B1